MIQIDCVVYSKFMKQIDEFVILTSEIKESIDLILVDKENKKMQYAQKKKLYQQHVNRELLTRFWAHSHELIVRFEIALLLQ